MDDLAVLQSPEVVPAATGGVIEVVMEDIVAVEWDFHSYFPYLALEAEDSLGF